MSIHDRRALRRDIKNALRRRERQRHREAVAAAATGDTAGLWRAIRSHEGKATEGLGTFCTYSGVSHEGQGNVNAALTAKMSASHTYDRNDPSFDQICQIVSLL